MSVDTVNYALTNVTQRIRNNPEAYSVGGKAKLLYIADCMRDCLMKEDIEGFDNFVDNYLAVEPDAADYLLDELFEELNITDREQLTTKLLEA